MASPEYKYVPGSTAPKDRLRLLIPDRPRTTVPPAMFEDAELNDLYAIAGNDLAEAAAQACEIIAMDRADVAASISLATELSISLSQIPGYFLDRAKQLREAARDIPAEEIDSYAYFVDKFGMDQSEYVGDTEETVDE